MRRFHPALLLALILPLPGCAPKRVNTNYTFQNLSCTTSALPNGETTTTCDCYHPWILRSAKGGKDAPTVLDCRKERPK